MAVKARARRALRIHPSSPQRDCRQRTEVRAGSDSPAPVAPNILPIGIPEPHRDSDPDNRQSDRDDSATVPRPDRIRATMIFSPRSCGTTPSPWSPSPTEERVTSTGEFIRNDPMMLRQISVECHKGSGSPINQFQLIRLTESWRESAQISSRHHVVVCRRQRKHDHCRRPKLDSLVPKEKAQVHQLLVLFSGRDRFFAEIADQSKGMRRGI